MDEEKEDFDDAAGEPQIQQRTISPKNAVPSGKYMGCLKISSLCKA